MSSWLSYITEFYLNQDIILSKENINNYKIKSTNNLKLENTNIKINKEIKNFLNRKSIHSKNINSNYFSLIKNVQVIQKKQKQTLFGSSYINLKKNPRKLDKSSPLNLFSKIQHTNKNKYLEKQKTIYISYKLTSKILSHSLIKSKIHLTLHKFLVLQKTNKVLKNSIYEISNTNNKEEILEKNKILFFNNEQKKHDHHNENEQEFEEQESKGSNINTIAKIANQNLPLSLFSLKKENINSIFSFKANFLKNYDLNKKQITNPPKIPLPTIGIFALYYILTKQGIITDQTAYATYKQEIETTHFEISNTYEKRLKIIRDNIEKEQAMARWGVLSKLISWLISFIASVTACILIASGVGAIMGAVILSAGLFSLTNSILEITGGWSKIADLLPTKNASLKKKALGIIKISIGIISLILSLISIIWGGYSQALRSLQSITQAATGILISGLGICIIGESISAHNFYYGIANLKETERNLEKLYFKRKDLMEKADWDLDHLEKLFEDLSYALDLQKETASIDNSYYYK